jgi:hypothetical protein
MAHNDKWVSELKDGLRNIQKYLDEVIKSYPGSADAPKVSSTLDFLRAASSLQENSSFEKCFSRMLDSKGPYLALVKDGVVKKKADGSPVPGKIFDSDYVFEIEYLSLTSSSKERYACKLADIFEVSSDILDYEINSFAKKAKSSKSKTKKEDDDDEEKPKKEKKSKKSALMKGGSDLHDFEKKMEEVRLYFACTLAYTVKHYVLTFPKVVSKEDSASLVSSNGISVPRAPYGGSGSEAARRLISNMLSNTYVRNIILPVVGGEGNLRMVDDLVKNTDETALNGLKEAADRAVKTGDVDSLIGQIGEKISGTIQRVEVSDGINACDVE